MTSFGDEMLGVVPPRLGFVDIDEHADHWMRKVVSRCKDYKKPTAERYKFRGPW